MEEWVLINRADCGQSEIELFGREAFATQHLCFLLKFLLSPF